MGLNKAVLALSLVMAVFVVGTITTSILQFIAGKEPNITTTSTTVVWQNTKTTETTTTEQQLREGLIQDVTPSRRFDAPLKLFSELFNFMMTTITPEEEQNRQTASKVPHQSVKNVIPNTTQSATISLVDARRLEESIKLFSDLVKQMTAATGKTTPTTAKTTNATAAKTTNATAATWQPVPYVTPTVTKGVELRRTSINIIAATWHPLIKETMPVDKVAAQWKPIDDVTSITTETRFSKKYTKVPIIGISIPLLSDLVNPTTTVTKEVAIETWRPVIGHTKEINSIDTLEINAVEKSIRPADDLIITPPVDSVETSSAAGIAMVTESEDTEVSTNDGSRKELEEWIAMVAKHLPEFNFTGDATAQS